LPFAGTGIRGHLQSQLAAGGIRLTRQRRIILSIVETANKHLDASQILRRAAKFDPEIDRATVYRTLALLKRRGLVDELDLMHVRGEAHYYERRVDRDHLHLTCLRCGEVREFESRLFDRLKRQVQQKCDFQIAVARLEIGGYCPKCRR
jgi:Fur family ferric uptake transcriptional regulator